MKIWIDLANSPHVLFFAPLVREFERRGIEVACTARDFAQTLGLARLHRLRVESIGRHGGKSSVGKAREILARTMALRRFAKAARPDIAVSHNSYAQALAARSLGIPFVTLMDYEHTPANHLSFRAADRILLPSVMQAGALARYGASSRKVTPYAGFKEQVYLEEFEPEAGAFVGLLEGDVAWRCVVAIARPPADFAIYHRFRNPLFDLWLDRVGHDPGIRVVLLPRTKEQRDRALALSLPSVVIPDREIDGPNVIYHADLVVSAGGTMNREAAVLGVPAYSLFAGRRAAVDEALEALGRLVFVRRVEDLGAIGTRKCAARSRLRNPGLRGQIVTAILGAAARLAA
jgi:predicted glycosyltransferase